MTRGGELTKAIAAMLAALALSGCVKYDMSVPSSLMGEWKTDVRNDYRDPKWAPEGHAYWKAGYLRGKEDCMNSKQKEGRT
jgi:hypothetical protein